MAESEKYSEKERLSADIGSPVPDTSAPILPTVNPEVRKDEKPGSTIHPAFYVMYEPCQKSPHSHELCSISAYTDGYFYQDMDHPELKHHSIQQMDPGHGQIS